MFPDLYHWQTNYKYLSPILYISQFFLSQLYKKIWLNIYLGQ